MKNLKTPLIAAALAAAIATTTGTCIITRGGPVAPPLPAEPPSPVRLLPEAVVPYPLDQ